jgi:Tfp pilus assembly protein PilP
MEHPTVEGFAPAWQALDSTAGLGNEAGPDLSAPIADPYPDMRLLGTITGGEKPYALLQVKQGTTKLLAAGEALGDVKVLSVAEDEVTVGVPGYTKTLRMNGPALLTPAGKVEE